MCGIVGILAQGNGRSPTEGEIRAMAARLEHRGPDGEGRYLHGPIGLGHRRLSIIDLEGGAQPIQNETGSVRVVFNGEIFNYIELRARLEAKGHRFYTQTDTEVLVHLYEEHGDDFVRHLNGQFAIALWDQERKRLVLARDHVGIVPLFLAQAAGRVLFASEVKAILPVLGAATPDPLALDQILTYWAPVSPRTMFKDIEELPPGHVLVAENGRVRRSRYWDWSFPVSQEEFWDGPEEELAEELRDLLIDAIRLRLRADVPVGAYLSGGLDSSVLVALIHAYTQSPHRTFSLEFEAANLDESPFQRLMIEHTGGDHSSLRCRGSAVAEHFVRTVWHTETPVLRTAPTPMMLLSGLVRREGYKVVMTGEGSDEVLGGYDIFKEAKVRRFWARRPDSSWRPLLLKRLYPYLELSTSAGQRYLQDFFAIGLENPGDPFFSHLPRWETTARAKLFYSSDLRAELADVSREAIGSLMPPTAARWHPFNQGQYVEARSLMSGYLLSSQGDRMLMANSVEGRFPFLDHRVIDFASRVHPNRKMRGLQEKYLLKVAVKGDLPHAIVTRHKQPYRSPDAAAFFSEGGAAPFVEELLSDAAVRRSGYFDPAKVALLLRKARRGGLASVSDNQAFVGILSTQIWHDLFVDGRSTTFVGNP